MIFNIYARYGLGKPDCPEGHDADCHDEATVFRGVTSKPTCEEDHCVFYLKYVV